ncbi:MAG TPA: outer membrane protein assembly factor BamD, partial [Desulfuromonadaceae bacterium]|nr:outer membrane protein assembly factor BamD [Desulfuromonadaceae bacterium]
YQEWLAHFPTNDLVPRVSYSLAWASFQAGDETNALVLFNNFSSQFPTNDFAPQARWWIADHFYRTGEFVAAETNYESVYRNWPASDLAYPARLMAGRAAAGRQGYKDANGYFADMINDTNCPPALTAQAQFALGTTLMSFESGDQTNLMANFARATNFFSRLISAYPGSDLAMPAQVKIANCNLQMNNYDGATNVYAAVFNSTNAPLSLRSEAQVGFGIALEKKSDLVTADDKKKLLRQALQNYLDVFYQNNQRDGEDVDPFWIKEAGLKALPLVESLGTGDPNKFIEQMETWLPQLKDSLEKRRNDFLQIKS